MFISNWEKESVTFKVVSGSFSFYSNSLFSLTLSADSMLTPEGVNYSFLQADEEWVAGACDALTLMMSPFHTEIPVNTRVMCSGICSRIVRFAAFTLPVIFRNLCVHSHTTRKDPVKTRDLSCNVYNAPLTISLNWRMISASARIVRSSLIAASFQFTHFSSCER